MRTALSTKVFAAAFCLAGVAMFVPTARAADDDVKDNAKRIAEIPNLRKAREQLSQVAKMLKNDIVDPKGYRHEALDLIDKAVVDLTNEINEYKGDEPAKK